MPGGRALPTVCTYEWLSVRINPSGWCTGPPPCVGPQPPRRTFSHHRPLMYSVVTLSPPPPRRGVREQGRDIQSNTTPAPAPRVLRNNFVSLIDRNRYDSARDPAVSKERLEVAPLAPSPPPTTYCTELRGNRTFWFVIFFILFIFIFIVFVSQTR